MGLFARKNTLLTGEVTSPLPSDPRPADAERGSLHGQAWNDEADEFRRRREAAKTAAFYTAATYQGTYLWDYLPELDRMQKAKRTAEALALLHKLIPVLECSMEIQGDGYPAGWYLRTAILLRRQGDLAEEVALLERYVKLQKPWGESYAIASRLSRARRLLAKSDYVFGRVQSA